MKIFVSSGRVVVIFLVVRLSQIMSPSQMVTEIVPMRGQVRIFMKDFTFKRVCSTTLSDRERGESALSAFHC